jgi:hypothetical protein
MSQQPIRVQSCWNGIAVFDAAPFHGKSPLRFRGVSDSLAKKHVEGSECCLIHADNPLSTERGVWLNPNVRVGYNSAAYQIVNPGDSVLWVSAMSKVTGVWKNRWARLYGSVRRRSEHWVVKKRIQQWKAKIKDPEVIERDGEKSEAVNCLINEMQVVIENGWAHV